MKYVECSVTPLVSRISAVSIHSGLRVILLCIALALWIQFVTFASSSLGRPSPVFVSLFFNVFVLFPCLSCISLFTAVTKMFKKKFTVAITMATVFSLMLRLAAAFYSGIIVDWLYMHVYRGVVCVVSCVCISLCVSNKCFAQAYIFFLCCCLQSIPWHSLVSVINKQSWTAGLRELHDTFTIIRHYIDNILEQCDRHASLYI